MKEHIKTILGQYDEGLIGAEAGMNFLVYAATDLGAECSKEETAILAGFLSYRLTSSDAIDALKTLTKGIENGQS